MRRCSVLSTHINWTPKIRSDKNSKTDTDFKQSYHCRCGAATQFTFGPLQHIGQLKTSPHARTCWMCLIYRCWSSRMKFGRPYVAKSSTQQFQTPGNEKRNTSKVGTDGGELGKTSFSHLSHQQAKCWRKKTTNCCDMKKNSQSIGYKSLRPRESSTEMY